MCVCVCVCLGYKEYLIISFLVYNVPLKKYWHICFRSKPLWKWLFGDMPAYWRYIYISRSISISPFTDCFSVEGYDITSHNECPVYNTKQSDSEDSAILQFWGMRSTSSLPLLLGPICPGVVAADRVLSMG